MLIEKLLQGVKITQVIPHGTDIQNLSVDGVSTSSGRVSAGDVFVCIKGTHTDGHLYSQAAENKGAVAIVAERPTGAAVPQIIVENTRSAAAFMWNNYYGDPARDMAIIGVTGTNGKTSVSFMIREILAAAGYSCGMIGTVKCMAGDEVLSFGGGSEVDGAAAAMTTPDPEFLYGMLHEMKNRGVTHVVMEVSSHSLALHKLDPIRADVAVFTGLSPEHLDFHGTMENYLSAKSVLFRTAGQCIINGDSPYSEKLCDLVRREYIRAGAGESCSIRATDIVRASGEVMYDLLAGDGRKHHVRCAMPGKFGVYNSVLAIGACLAAGVTPDTACAAMGGFCGVPGRMETVARLGALRVIRDYAHTPDALMSALEIITCDRGDGKVWLVFGCGGDRDRLKRPQMGKVASDMADFTVITSDNCRSENPCSIISDIMSGFDVSKPHKVIPEREEAVRYAIASAGKNDTVLLCGKGHEDYEITAEGKRPFDEVVIALSAIEERRLREAEN